MPQTETPTEVGEIVVWGNRRPHNSGGSFGGGANGGGRGIEGGVHQEELPEDPNPPPPYEYDPCDTVNKRRERAIDAAAARALQEFERRATEAGETINTRERGAYLFLNPDGSVSVGPIATGPAFVYGGNGTTGQLSYGGYPIEWLIGSIHSHNQGGYVPSTAPNGEGDLAHYNTLRTNVLNAGGDPNRVRLYIAAQKLVGADQTPYNAIFYFDHRNIEQDIANFTPSIEVDRDGLPCPPM